MQIPENWTELVRSIREVCPDAVLAGGALRDLDNDRPVKDLDIFIEVKGEDGARRRLAKLEEAGFEVSHEPSELSCYPEDQNLEVILLANVEGWTGFPVQLIFVRWPTDRIVERFDYGICQLSYDGETVTRGEHYDADKAAQVFRLRRERPTPISMRGSIRRYARLVNEKYQGWDWAAFDHYSDAELFADLGDFGG